MTEHPIRPRAISMWDFSWRERRWPGLNWDIVKEMGETGVKTTACTGQ